MFVSGKKILSAIGAFCSPGRRSSENLGSSSLCGVTVTLPDQGMSGNESKLEGVVLIYRFGLTKFLVLELNRYLGDVP